MDNTVVTDYMTAIVKENCNSQLDMWICRSVINTYFLNGRESNLAFKCADRQLRILILTWVLQNGCHAAVCKLVFRAIGVSLFLTFLLDLRMFMGF